MAKFEHLKLSEKQEIEYKKITFITTFLKTIRKGLDKQFFYK